MSLGMQTRSPLTAEGSLTTTSRDSKMHGQGHRRKFLFVQVAGESKTHENCLRSKSLDSSGRSNDKIDPPVSWFANSNLRSYFLGTAQNQNGDRTSKQAVLPARATDQYTNSVAILSSSDISRNHWCCDCLPTPPAILTRDRPFDLPCSAPFPPITLLRLMLIDPAPTAPASPLYR